MYGAQSMPQQPAAMGMPGGGAQGYYGAVAPPTGGPIDPNQQQQAQYGAPTVPQDGGAPQMRSVTPAMNNTRSNGGYADGGGGVAPPGGAYGQGALAGGYGGAPGPAAPKTFLSSI